MSKINEMIKELQVRQKKIDYLTYLRALIKNDKQATEFKDVQKEIVEAIDPLLNELATKIESEVSSASSANANLGDDFLTQGEKQALKVVAQQAEKRLNGNNPPAPSNTPYANNNPQPSNLPKNKDMLGSHDKMQFAMSNRHLADKSVKVLDGKNNHVANGKVVGLDAPFVLVKTEQGPTIEVPLDKIVTI